MIQFSVEKASPLHGVVSLRTTAQCALLRVRSGSSLLLCYFNEERAASSSLSVDCSKGFVSPGKMVLGLIYIELSYLKWTETLCVYFKGSVKIHSIAHTHCQTRKWSRTKYLTWSAICPSCLWVLSLLGLPTVSLNSSTGGYVQNWFLVPRSNCFTHQMSSVEQHCLLVSVSSVCVCRHIAVTFFRGTCKLLSFSCLKGHWLLQNCFQCIFLVTNGQWGREKKLIAETSIVNFYATESLL